MTTGAALTACCDRDVEGYCEKGRHRRGVYSIGAVGKCLAKQLASGQRLAMECQQLILAAAPQVRAPARAPAQGLGGHDGCGGHFTHFSCAFS